LLSCRINDSRFRDGDLLILHRGDPEGQDALRCVLDYDDETQLELLFLKGNLFSIKDQPDGWIADEDFLDLSSFSLDALDQVADTMRGREIILPLLAGEKSPDIDYAQYQRSWEAG
jgi:DNA replication ATP-dependent helicase Dna2